MVRRSLALRLLVALGLALVASAAFAFSLDRRTGPRAPVGAFDAIVVLGCRVNPGGVPSHALARRARHAARLYREGKAPLVIVTGGVGDHGPSEASVAASILEEHGVPRRAILLEDTSTSTWENATHARERYGAGRVLVVTDAFHTLRAERIFEGVFGEAVAVGSRSPWRSARASGAIREVLAVGIYAALGRIEIIRSRPSGAADAPRRTTHLTSLEPSFLDAALSERARTWGPRDRAAALTLATRPLPRRTGSPT